ncbi:MAG: acetyl-CoA hydrolase [Burkholderiales bacterium]|nr:acetyl-CoA hydrolase [Burkholderiales bacterium]
MIRLAEVIRAADGVLIGQASAEPQTLTEALVAGRAAYPGARLFLGVNYAGIVRPEHADHLRLSAYCGAGANRALADAGVLDIHPHPYSRFAALIREKKIPSDVVLVQVSPPNEAGAHSLGIAAEYLVPALAACRAIVAEINDRVPWTHSERLLRKGDFALSVSTSRPPALPRSRSPSEAERTIARHAARFIGDGATLEFGLGALPDAVCAELGGRRRLRVHSGALGDGVVDLMRDGIVEEADCGLLLGSEKLFAFAHRNPAIRLRSSEYTHDPRVLGAIERFVAINAAVEVDLTGQVNAEVAAGRYVGAVGGALDFVRAANHSPGGVSLLLVRADRIVAELSGPVATPRSEAGVVVTEYGAADLRGLTLAERRAALLAVAAPENRARLARAT